jgi:glycerol-3-phosphate dehydrogenase
MEGSRRALEGLDQDDGVKREEMVRRIVERKQPWDIVVIGGGAVGAGIAVDASSRGLDTLMVDREDFGKGTSSRSTKLVHGGVRYLEQGNISLVMEALRERGLLLRNAPHVVRELSFVVPNYSWWEAPFYGVGMKVYDLLAGKYNFGRSRMLSQTETLARLPNIQREGLRGGVLYYDGQFDDARLLIQLVATAADHGGTVANYMEAVGLKKDDQGLVSGVALRDRETNRRYDVASKVVINATGIFTDETRRLAEAQAEDMVSPSQGIHVVLERSFLPGESAIMVPRTSDGRVLFAIPWHDRTLVGTTDTAIEEPSYEPTPLPEEIDFVLSTAGEYLSRAPMRSDVLSVFVGIRPLVSTKSAAVTRTSNLSRGHAIHFDANGLMSIVGGKWTTYRRMAEECVDQAITFGDLRESRCVTESLPIHGYRKSVEPELQVYGADAEQVRDIARQRPELARPLHPQLPYTGAEIVFGARSEMACTVDDALSRRTRALILNASAAIEVAPRVARLLAEELGRDAAWADAETARFSRMAEGYRLVAQPPSIKGCS